MRLEIGKNRYETGETEEGVPRHMNDDSEFSENALPTTAVALSQNLKYRPTADDDLSLVRKARAGSYEAFEQLFERHRLLVYRFAYQMAPRRDDAEDIVQEAFVRAYQNLHKFRDDAKFTTWVLRIVTNLCTDQARMSTRRQALEQQESRGGLLWMTEGDVDDPVANLEGDRRVLALRKALLALPVHHRNVIVLRDIEEREYPEIAKILNCTIGGAKLRVLRARRALKERIAPLLGEEAS